MAFNFALPLRIVQAIFAIIVLGLTAYGKSCPDNSISHFVVLIARRSRQLVGP